MRPKRKGIKPATPLQVRHGFARIDTDPTQRRAECDPSLPIGQDSPDATRSSVSGIALFVLSIVLVILCAVLVVWGVRTQVLRSEVAPEPAKAVRPVKVLT